MQLEAAIFVLGWSDASSGGFPAHNGELQQNGMAISTATTIATTSDDRCSGPWPCKWQLPQQSCSWGCPAAFCAQHGRLVRLQNPSARCVPSTNKPRDHHTSRQAAPDLKPAIHLSSNLGLDPDPQDLDPPYPLPRTATHHIHHQDQMSPKRFAKETAAAGASISLVAAVGWSHAVMAVAPPLGSPYSATGRGSGSGKGSDISTGEGDSGTGCWLCVKVGNGWNGLIRPSGDGVAVSTDPSHAALNKSQDAPGRGRWQWLPYDTRPVVQLSAGEHHTLSLNADGNVWAWGANGEGQCGTAAVAAPPPSPVPVADAEAANTDTKKAAESRCSDARVCGGISGCKPAPRRLSPIHHEGLFGVVVGSGSAHAARRNSGSDNRCGSHQPTNNARPSITRGPAADAIRQGLSAHIAVRVPFTLQIRQIACGARHNLAVDLRGGVWAWGWNAYGQCGVAALAGGSAASRAVVTPPVRVQGGALGGVPCRAVAAGLGHSLALTEAGQVIAWGWNDAGQCGPGSEPEVLDPPPAVRRGADRAVGANGEGDCSHAAAAAAAAAGFGVGVGVGVDDDGGSASALLSFLSEPQLVPLPRHRPPSKRATICGEAKITIAHGGFTVGPGGTTEPRAEWERQRSVGDRGRKRRWDPGAGRCGGDGGGNDGDGTGEVHDDDDDDGGGIATDGQYAYDNDCYKVGSAAAPRSKLAGGMVDLREELSEEEEEDEEDEEDVIKISCGGRHSLALAAGGRLYGWGSNTRGQLGLPRAVYDSDSTFGVTRQQIPRLLLPAGPHPPSLHVPVCRSCASDGDVTSFLVLSGSSVLEGDEGGDDLGAAHQDDDIDKFQMSVQTSVGTIGDACGLGGGCVWQAARAGTGAAEVGGLVQSVRRSQQQATAVAEGGSVISGLGGNVICYCGGGDVDAGHHHSGGGVIGGAVSMYEHGVRRGLWGGALSGELVVEDVEGGWSHTVVCCKIRKGENK